MNYPQTRRRDPKLIAGLVVLALANTMHYMLPRLGLGELDGIDFITGALMGLSIGLLLWSVATSRRCCATGTDSTA